MVRGVIDNLDEDWALLVLDDGQRLYWPCERLPPDTRPGMAVVLNLQHGAAAIEQSSHGTWTGTVEITTQEQGRQTIIRLGDQAIVWSDPQDATETGETVTIRMAIDLQDTERRRREVQALLDNLFATNTTPPSANDTSHPHATPI